MTENSKHRISLLLCAGLVAGLGGCSTLEKHVPGLAPTAPATSGSAEVEGVYYSGSPDLPLRRSPGGAIIKLLPQYTKLHREQLERSFAYVRVDATGETGWVENAKLVWRLPKQTSPQPAHDAGSQPAAESSSPQTVEAAASPAPQADEAPPSPAAVSPSSAGSRSTVAPSIFNPY